MDKQEQLKTLPKVDELLKRDDMISWIEKSSREVVADAIRDTLEYARCRLLQNLEADTHPDVIAGHASQLLSAFEKRSLRRVINATGILLHTNLGRARLPERAVSGVCDIAQNYSTLEFDLSSGGRGNRHDHVSDLIARVTGAEAAIVVNNNAAATLLCLAAIGAGREVIVSRGELVEIGGSFRIPEIMELGGALLKEVGTTNKTHLFDYEHAITNQTAALLKVHTSNYRIVGFTQEVDIDELAKLARENELPLIHDLGSGLLIDLASYGLSEPTVAQSLSMGSDIVLFSGDKLLGGPQAGIIAGKKYWIDIIKKHPLARAMRVDKMTLAACEEIFRLYLDSEQALATIPVLSMLTSPVKELENKAERMIERLTSCAHVAFSVEHSIGRVGGGCAPMLDIPSVSIAVSPESMSAAKLETALRLYNPPIIARIHEERVLLDMRTISEKETPIVERALLDLLS